MCICIYIYIYIYTYVYIYIYMCVCVCMHACMYVSMCACVLLYACIYVYNNIIIVITTMSSHIDVQRQHISCLEDQSAACCSEARKETQMRCAKADNIPSNSE